jgi:hypothetical protein
VKPETKIILKNICLALSCIVTIIAFLRPADGVAPGLLLVLLWGTGPYIVFWIATFLLERFSKIPQVPGIGFGMSILVLLYALACYLTPLNHKRSTEALIYFFAPYWLYVFVLPALGFLVLAAWLTNLLLAWDTKRQAEETNLKRNIEESKST